jgi:hypothetical protein
MDADRLREIDQKIKRYEGIDELLNQGLHEKDGNAANQEQTDDEALKNSKEGENEQG